MSIFNLSDFERQGKIENDVHFTSMHELKQLLYQISDNALRSLQIYTPDMEAEIYNDSVFIKNLLSFCRGNRHAQIQILAADTSSAVKRGHQLIRLAQEITSSVEIRIPAEEYRQDKLGFLLADHKAFIYRPDIKYTDGIFNADCKYRATKLA